MREWDPADEEEDEPELPGGGAAGDGQPDGGFAAESPTDWDADVGRWQERMLGSEADPESRPEEAANLQSGDSRSMAMKTASKQLE